MCTEKLRRDLCCCYVQIYACSWLQVCRKSSNKKCICINIENICHIVRRKVLTKISSWYRSELYHFSAQYFHLHNLFLFFKLGESEIVLPFCAVKIKNKVCSVIISVGMEIISIYVHDTYYFVHLRSECVLFVWEFVIIAMILYGYSVLDKSLQLSGPDILVYWLNKQLDYSGSFRYGMVNCVFYFNDTKYASLFCNL